MFYLLGARFKGELRRKGDVYESKNRNTHEKQVLLMNCNEFNSNDE